MIKKYSKIIPEEYLAVRWKENNWDEVKKFVGDYNIKLNPHDENTFFIVDGTHDTYEEMGSQRYKKGVLRHILGNVNTHALYSIGENILHYTLMYGMLLHEKVLLNGKEISLYNAFEKVNVADSSVKTLKFKEGVTTLDGKPLTDIHDEFID